MNAKAFDLQDGDLAEALARRQMERQNEEEARYVGPDEFRCHQCHGRVNRVYKTKAGLICASCAAEYYDASP